MSDHKVIIIEGVTPPLYLVNSGVPSPLDEKALGKQIPQYNNLTLQAKERKVTKWLDTEATVVRHIEPRQYLPNAHKKKAKSREALKSGASAILSSANIFAISAAGYMLLALILCGLHISALQQAEQTFRSILSINSSSAQIAQLLTAIITAVVPRHHWKGKHYTIKRNAVLDYRKKSSYGLSVQIQDFSRIKVKYKQHTVKAVFPYRDTVLLIIGANNAQIREASAYIESSSVILLNSASGELIPTKIPISDVSAYDPAILKQIQTKAHHIAAFLRWWWGDALEDEEAWARQIVQVARASFGKPDSRYIRVELDPKKLRSAILYQVLLSFLDEVEAAGFMTAEELAPYRQGAKDVFDPAPPEPVQLRHAEDPDVFLEIMRDLLRDPPSAIVAENERFVKKDKPLAAWRIISKEHCLVFLESDWARIYSKLVRAHKDIDCSYFQREHWERDMQKLLCEQGLIKAPSSGYRYRYDLMGDGTRNSTYVVVIPAYRLEN